MAEARMTNAQMAGQLARLIERCGTSGITRNDAKRKGVFAEYELCRRYRLIKFVDRATGHVATPAAMEILERHNAE